MPAPSSHVELAVQEAERTGRGAARRRLAAVLRFAQHHRLALAFAVLVAWYAISASAAFLAPSSGWRLAIDRACNRHGRYGNPEGPLEACEAVAWLGALVAYAIVLARTFRVARWNVNLWIPLLTLLSFVALGEEVSWGQHLVQWRAPEVMQRVNLQQETNFHNLDVGAAVGARADGEAYEWLRSLMRWLNPAFYALTFLLWVALPLAKRWGPLRRWRWTRSIPAPRGRTMLLFAVGALVFAPVDRLVIDVGEVFELNVSLVAWLAALDLLGAPAPPAVPPRRE